MPFPLLEQGEEREMSLLNAILERRRYGVSIIPLLDRMCKVYNLRLKAWRINRRVSSKWVNLPVIKLEPPEPYPDNERDVEPLYNTRNRSIRYYMSNGYWDNIVKQNEDRS